jgi:Zn-finger nucleic acid-binding protein
MPVEYEGVRVYHCGGCGGHWLSQARLDLIVNRRDLQMPEPVRQKMMDLADASNSVDELTCFTCGKRMVRGRFRHWDDIQIDRCPQCQGIWLDRGELEKCQIYWEYAQDHPEQWKNAEVAERKALLELEWQRRREALREAGDRAKAARGFGAYPGGGLARLLVQLFGR